MYKKEFKKIEAFQDILEYLEYNDYSDLCYGSDLHHEVFNTDYYILEQIQAEKALTKYGVFKAFGEIKEYEMLHFGEIYTDFNSPKAVSNMLYYIVGENVINESGINSIIDKYDCWNDIINEDCKQELIDYINNEIELLKED